MPFPAVDIEDHLKIAAYHEATHMFFSMYYAYGLSGGVEIYDNGLGLAKTRGKDIFSTDSHNGNLFDEAIKYIAPSAVEQILIGNNSLAYDKNYFKNEFKCFPSFEYPCDEDVVVAIINSRHNENPFAIGGTPPDAPMAACALIIESILYREQMKRIENIELSKEQMLEHFLKEYEEVEKVTFKTLSDESVIGSICDLAENLYRSMKLSKDEVLGIFKPYFIKEGWFFNDS